MSQTLHAQDDLPEELAARTVVPDEAAKPRVLHVTCPDGHRLEAPCVLGGQDVVCPYCAKRFPFRYEDSEEYRTDRDSSKPQQRPAAPPWIAWTVLAGAAATALLAAWYLLA